MPGLDPPETAPGGVARGGRSWRIGLSWVSGILVLAAVILVASHFTELQHFAELAERAQPVWLLAAAGLQGATYLCAAAVWHGALRRAGVERGFWSIVPLGLAKLFTDQALPTGGIGGTLLVVSGMGRRGIPQGIGMAAVLIGMIAFYIAYLAAVAIGLALLYRRGVLDSLMLAAAAVFLCVAFGVPMTVLAVRRWSRLQAKLGPMFGVAGLLMKIPGFADLLAAMAAAPGELLRDPLPFIRASLLQFMIFVLDAATLWVMLHAVGSDGNPDIAFAGFMMASVAATVGPMPLGLGTFEAVLVAVLHLQGVSIEVALTATLLLRGFTFWLPMIPGLILARRELRGRGG